MFIPVSDPPLEVDRYDFPFPGRDAVCATSDPSCYGSPSTVVTQNFGADGHAGDDIASGLAAEGQPVTAIAHGQIVDRRLDDGSGRGWGNAWLVWHVEAQPDGTTVSRYSLYAHMASDLPAGLDVGSMVGRGQVLGYIGSTGFSTGPHLHLEIKDTMEFGVGYYPEGIPDGYHDPSEFLVASLGTSPTATTSAVLNRVLDGEITVPLQTDRFFFDASAGQEVTITADWGAGGRMNWRVSSWDINTRGLAAGGIRLLSADETELARGTNFEAHCLWGQACHSQIPGFTIPFDGTFTVEVSADGFRTGHYQLAISDPESEFESLTLNMITSSRFEVAGETQEWQFTGRADQLVSIGYDTQRNLQETRIVGPDGEVLATFPGEQSVGALRNLRLPADGIYRFELRESVNDDRYNSLLGFDYDLYLTTPTEVYAHPDDHGDSASTATILGPTTAGSLEIPGDVDWFRFDAVAGERYVIQTTLDDSVISLFDADGTSLLVKDDDGGDGLASRMTWTAQVDALHYVRVAAYSNSQTGRYRLEVQRSVPEAQAVSDHHLGQVDSRSLSGSLTIGERRAYRFQAAHDGLLTIELTQTGVPSGLQEIRYAIGSSPVAGDPESDRPDAGEPASIVRDQRVDARVVAGQNVAVFLDGLSDEVSNFTLNLNNLVGMADGVLTVYGTEADNRIELGLNSPDPRNLTINGIRYDTSRWGVDESNIPNSIHVTAGSGDDVVRIDPMVTLPAWINGQSGADELTGGGGDDRLLGGPRKRPPKTLADAGKRVVSVPETTLFPAGHEVLPPPRGGLTSLRRFK